MLKRVSRLPARSIPNVLPWRMPPGLFFCGGKNGCAVVSGYGREVGGFSGGWLGEACGGEGEE